MTLILGACSSPEERFEEHLSRAAALLAEERHEDALLELQSALKLDPESAEANERLAEVYLGSGDRRRAALHFSEAQRLDPSRIESALQHAAIAPPARAEQIVARLLREHPDDARVQRTHSALSMLRDRPARALAAALEATRLGPDDPGNWLQLASVQRESGRRKRARAEPFGELHEAAYAAYERADTLAGGSLAARLGKARLLASWHERHQEAPDAFRSAVALARDRGDPADRLLVARAFEEYARRRGDAALRHEALREQIEVAPGALDVWDRLARAAAADQGEEAADRVYRDLIAARPDAPPAHIAYSAYLAQSGRRAEATAYLERVIQGGLDLPPLWEQRIRLELAARRIADARSVQQRFDARHPGHALARRSAARIELAEGRLDAAISLLDEPADHPPNAEDEALRAQIELGRGRIEAAKAAVSRALDQVAGSPERALRLQAAVHAEAREWRIALQALERAEKQGAALGSAEKLLRARAHYELGDAVRGREQLSALLREGVAAPEVVVEYARREGEADAENARAILERTLERAPRSILVLEALTRLDLLGDRADAARQRLDRRIASAPDPRELLLRAEVHAALGRLQEAEADALRAFEAAPGLERAIELSIGIFRRQDRLAEAQRSFEDAEQAGVLHPGARVLLGVLRELGGDQDGALEIWESVLASEDPPASAGRALAAALESRGVDLARAEELAANAARALPRSTRAAHTLGRVHLRRGRALAARREMRRALELTWPGDPLRPALLHDLGLALGALGRRAAAADAFERALALDPAFPGAEDARTRLAELRAPSAEVR